MSKFRYSLVSDLHINCPHPKTPPFEQNVIIAGDTSNGLDGLRYLNKLQRKGHQLFAVDGNHEHYSNHKGRSIEATEARFYEALDQEQVVRVSDGLTLLGCSGWYLVENADLWLGYMNDGRYVGSAADVTARAIFHAGWLDDRLGELEGRAIVVTHTAPVEETLDPRFVGHYSNQWYWNPLLEDVLRRHAEKIAVWHHGHTHTSRDRLVHGVRIVTNPRGYPRENPKWAPITLEIEL